MRKVFGEKKNFPKTEVFGENNKKINIKQLKVIVEF